MAKVLVLLDTTQDVGTLSFSDWGKGRVSREVAKLVEGLGVGAFTGSIDVQNAPAFASGTLTLSSASGTVGGTIGGQAVTVTASGGDTATAAALAVAINANTTANTYVVATSALGVVTVTAIVPGTIGNSMSLVASGTGVTASGARLTGGTLAPGLNAFTC